MFLLFGSLPRQKLQTSQDLVIYTHSLQYWFIFVFWIINYLFCIVKCVMGVGWVSLWDSSGKSQKPLYSKLENYPKFQNKSPDSILRLLPSYTSTKVVSGMSSKRRAFSIWWILWRNLVIINRWISFRNNINWWLTIINKIRKTRY